MSLESSDPSAPNTHDNMTSLPPPPTHKGQVQLGRLRSATNQDGFDTPLCAPAVGFSCLGGAGCDVCCAAVFCPCYLFGANVKMLRSGSHHSACADAFACRRSEACFKFLIPYSCIGMGMVASGIAAPIAFCPLAMYTASYRHLIRKEFGITSRYVLLSRKILLAFYRVVRLPLGSHFNTAREGFLIIPIRRTHAKHPPDCLPHRRLTCISKSQRPMRPRVQ